MTEEELLLQLARLLTRREDTTATEARRLLLELVLRLRALLATLPPDGPVVRTIIYANLRPQILALLQNYATSYYSTLRLTLPSLDAAIRALYTTLFQLDRPLEPALLQDLLRTTNVLNRPAAALLAPGPTGIAPFTYQLERLLDTSVRAAILREAPTPEILNLVTPANARTIRKGTVANALLDRTAATTAAIYWSLVTPIATEAATAAESTPPAWRWNAVLDPKTCPICRPLHNTLAANPEDFPNGPPPLHPRCVTGKTPVLAGTAVAAFRSRYTGKLITVTTESGSCVTITAQHPMLTPAGWVRADTLTDGDYLIRDLFDVPARVADQPHFNQTPVFAEDLFNTLLSASPVPPITVPASAMQFHGDGALMKGHVDIVLVDGELQQALNTPAVQGSLQGGLIHREASLLNKTLLCPEDNFFICLNSAASGNMSLFEQSQSLIRGELTLPEVHSLTTTAWLDPHFSEPPVHDVPTAPVLLSECLDAEPAIVRREQIVAVKRETIGHEGCYVYDFATVSGIYSIAHLLSHNCRCIVVPLLS